jgi:hypothetical protein
VIAALKHAGYRLPSSFSFANLKLLSKDFANDLNYLANTFERSRCEFRHSRRRPLGVHRRTSSTLLELTHGLSHATALQRQPVTGVPAGYALFPNLRDQPYIT